ncbi:hypothetical protein NHX12_018578 [Muraenolepis orangiensis]|uniref:Pentatricopeptide repeat-containing protein n=1 Tax=Muraenolepis orangiensis TaxID=630683 RepID=A0A9Q0IY45_9TELE|nr:hypothetical protein NHX12_018578 [Muraenolepis orangiensis]
MLNSAAYVCARRGSQLLKQVARSSHVYAVQRSPLAKTLNTRYPWSSQLWLTTDSRCISGVTRHKSIVSASFDDPNPLASTAKPTDQVDRDHDGEQFGTLSSDMASRRSFRKSSPGVQNQCFQEDDDGEEEKRRKPFMAKGRNTSYWYFLQCKKLLKENKMKKRSLIPTDATYTAMFNALPIGESPNLLDLFEKKSGAMVSIGIVDGASDRLALIGGGHGFLEKMVSSGLSPDLRTLTLLADTMEPGGQSLQMLLEGAKLHKVKLDVAFFNTVIRRIAKAGDLDAAKAVLRVMYQRHVNTDVQTYGCLALACDQKKDGLQLLRDMEFKKRNNYLIQIDGFRGYYQQWLMSMPAAQGANVEQTEEPTGTDVAPQQEQEPPGTDGPAVKQMNQNAAARRFHSRKAKVPRSAASL